MASLDRHAGELRGLVNAFLQRFRAGNAAAVQGPHADLSGQELHVVERLGDDGPAMMRELAEYLNLAANSVTSLVDGLERRGVVRRTRSEEDRRVVRVELTDAGWAAHRGGVNEMLAVLKSMLKALSSAEQETFVALFRKIAKA